jgi:hypothetical protein
MRRKKLRDQLGLSELGKEVAGPFEAQGKQAPLLQGFARLGAKENAPGLARGRSDEQSKMIRRTTTAEAASLPAEWLVWVSPALRWLERLP